MTEGRKRSGKLGALAAVAVLVVLGVGLLVLVRSPAMRRKLSAFLDGASGAARQEGALPRRRFPTVDSLPQIGSGWIYLGPYDARQGAYREGPYVEVVVCVAGGKTGPAVPHPGDVLRILKPNQVSIGNYRIEGLTHQDEPPPKVDQVLGQLDLTGLWLKGGELVVARDVQAPWRFGKPRAIWCRVGACDPASDPCAQALEALRAGRDSL